MKKFLKVIITALSIFFLSATVCGALLSPRDTYNILEPGIWYLDGSVIQPSDSSWDLASSLTPIPNGYFTNLYSGGILIGPYFDRTGTTLSPHTAGDSLDMGNGSIDAGEYIASGDYLSAKSYISNGGGIISIGNSTDFTIPTTSGAKMLWMPSLSAFRAGSASTQWGSANIGEYSFAVNFATKASGPASTAFGEATISSGVGSISGGYDSQANGNQSVALGYFAIANGNYNFVYGFQSTANNDSAIILGNSITSSSGSNLSFGKNFTNSTGNSLAIGFNAIDLLITEGSANFQDTNILTTGTLDANTTTITSTARTPLLVTGSQASAPGLYQINIKNTGGGSGQSSDFVATSSNGSASTHYLRMGINCATSGNSPFTAVNDAYLYAIDDNLHIGALGASKIIAFYATGGSSHPARVGHFNSTGLTLGFDETAPLSNKAGSLTFISAGNNAYTNTFVNGTNTANVSYTLPTAAPAANGYPLTSTTAGVMSWGGAVVAGGGTGATSFNANGVVLGGTTTTGALQSIANSATAGVFLRNVGSSSASAPQWSTLVLPNSATANQVVISTSTNNWGGSSSLLWDATTLTIGAGVASRDYIFKFDGETNDGTITWMEDENWFSFNRPLRTATSLYRRYYHVALASANPGASGATWVNPDANTTGGWNLTADAHILIGETDIHSDWNGASDPKFEVRFATNVDNTGGAVGDTVNLLMTVYYKGVGDTATKTQQIPVETVIGQAARYKQFKVVFPLNYDEVGNVLDVGDVISFKLNLVTGTSEVDDIIISDMSFSYLKTHVGIEDGDE